MIDMIDGVGSTHWFAVCHKLTEVGDTQTIKNFLSMQKNCLTIHVKLTTQTLVHLIHHLRVLKSEGIAIRYCLGQIFNALGMKSIYFHRLWEIKLKLIVPVAQLPNAQAYNFYDVP